MITPPHQYSEWVNILDSLKKPTRDNEILSALKMGVIDWQDGIAQRLINRLLELVNYRFNSASDKFQLSMSRSHGNESDTVQAIVELKKDLAFTYEIANLPSLPEETRTQCTTMIKEQANKVQSALENSARNDRSGKLASIVRNHPINKF